MTEYLENRIKQLKEADVIACEKRWNMNLPKLERALWRENSNELTARRRELEDALEFLNGNSVPQPKQEVCPTCKTDEHLWEQEQWMNCNKCGNSWIG